MATVTFFSTPKESYLKKLKVLSELIKKFDIEGFYTKIRIHTFNNVEISIYQNSDKEQHEYLIQISESDIELLKKVCIDDLVECLQFILLNQSDKKLHSIYGRTKDNETLLFNTENIRKDISLQDMKVELYKYSTPLIERIKDYFKSLKNKSSGSFNDYFII